MASDTATPLNEAERLAAVRRYEILDTPPDGSFDRITAIAAQLFNVPIAIISVVDHDRIWFKSHHGIDVEEVKRDPGLCASAILKNEPHILSDATCDAHALSNPLVSGELGLRFYAGVPLRTHDGFNLGTLCVIDKEPRETTPEELQYLTDLGAVVMDQLELRISAKKALAAKDDLLKEMHHRIGNNLQIVSNFIALEGLHADSASQQRLINSSNRVARIGRVHHKLSQTTALQTIDVKQYLTELCDDISKSLFSNENTYTLIVNCKSAELPSEIMTNLGLIVNELVTNAAKHAYPAGQTGNIFVTYGCDDTGQHYLSVADEGVGLASNLDAPLSSGFGTKLVASLVQQIKGNLSTGPRKNGSGTETTIRFRLY